MKKSKKKDKEFIYNDQYIVKWRMINPETGFWTTCEETILVPLIGKNKDKEKGLHEEAKRIVLEKYKDQKAEIISCSYA